MALWLNHCVCTSDDSLVLNVQSLLGESSVDPSNQHIRQSRSKWSLLIKDKRTRGVSKRGGASLRSYRDMVQIHQCRFLPWRKLSEGQSATCKSSFLVRDTLGILHLAAELDPHQEKKTPSSLYCSVTVASAPTLKPYLNFPVYVPLLPPLAVQIKHFTQKPWLRPATGLWSHQQECDGTASSAPFSS